MGFELHGRAAVPPVLGAKVLGLGDIAGERPELVASAAAATAAAPLQRLAELSRLPPPPTATSASSM